MKKSQLVWLVLSVMVILLLLDLLAEESLIAEGVGKVVGGIIGFVFLYLLISFSLKLETKNQIIEIEVRNVDGNSVLEAFKKISSKSNIFISRVSDVDLFFSEKGLCVVSLEHRNIIYSLSSIVELKRTNAKISNATVWSIVVLEKEELVEFKFTHNVRLWNRNFVEFHRLLSKVNSTAVKTPWNYLRM